MPKMTPHQIAERIITFDKSALKEICRLLKIPYDKDIVAFTKKGAIKNIFELIEEMNK